MPDRTRIVTRKHFELDAVLSPSVPGLISLELFQHFPEAQRPHWRRILQLNLTPGEIGQLRDLLDQAA